MRAFRKGLGYDLCKFRMCVALNERTERQHEVNVSVAIRIPDVRAAPAFEDDRASRVDGGSTRR
jgi:hypothetical protein